MEQHFEENGQSVGMHGSLLPYFRFHVILLTRATKESKSNGMKFYFMIC
jgi:hypothetical protein